ncbi:PREDICTED: protein FAM170A [Condylura cristata]|uniref:protein FAM170A n=1 Tax=Condylura cristata TaxID=143302 RepID=UPI000642C500|nr:PREDICTED: protein FAM170A [Condylura cristata]
MKRRQKRKHLENEESQESAEKGGGISKPQEDASRPESTGVPKGLRVGEVSSASEYFSCVSSPRKFIHAGVRRLQRERESPRPRSPLVQFQEQGEMAPPSQHVSFSYPSSYKTCVSSVYINKEERGMKIYYMKVQMKKGVAVSWESKETAESLEKQLKVEELILPEKVRQLSYMGQKILEDVVVFSWEREKIEPLADRMPMV